MAKVVLAVLAGLVVFAFLFYWGGVQTSDPPRCFGMLGYTVPCDTRVSWAAGTFTAAVVLVVLWLGDRRR